MSGSKPHLKVRTLDEMFKKISESSENDPKRNILCLIYVPAWKFEYMRVVPL
jgi:hypothetical protein